MKDALFTGLCTALITPFRDDAVHYDMLEILLERQIGAGADAIVLGGTTGESATLTFDEKLELFRRGVSIAGGRCKIIAGTGSNCTASAVRLSRAAEETGVDGLLVVTPYYNKCTQPGLIAHYRAVCDAVTLPVIAYNVPSRTGVDIRVDTCKALAEIPNIAGIKEAGGDISKIARLTGLLPVWSGNDDQTAAVMALGGVGVISVASNIVPGRMKALTDAALGGRFDVASDLQRSLLELVELLFCQVNPIPVKAALNLMGYDVGPCRLPLDAMTEENRRRLMNCLDDLGVSAYN